MQLDFLGVPRKVEISMAFGGTPFLLKGIQVITLGRRALGRMEMGQ